VTPCSLVTISRTSGSRGALPRAAREPAVAYLAGVHVAADFGARALVDDDPESLART
jgi:hypothetical protein